MLGELPDREALRLQLEGALEVEDPSRTPQRFALLSCALEASLRAGYELLSFLLRDPPKDRYEQFTHGTLGIEPRFSKADDANTKPVEGQNGLHVACHRATEAIERPNEQHVEGAAMRVCEQSSQHGARSRRAGLLLVDAREDPTASGGELFDLGPLVAGVLFGGGGAQIESCSHGAMSAAGAAGALRGRFLCVGPTVVGTR